MVIVYRREENKVDYYPLELTDKSNATVAKVVTKFCDTTGRRELGVTDATFEYCFKPFNGHVKDLIRDGNYTVVSKSSKNDEDSVKVEL